MPKVFPTGFCLHFYPAPGRKAELCILSVEHTEGHLCRIGTLLASSCSSDARMAQVPRVPRAEAALREGRGLVRAGPGAAALLRAARRVVRRHAGAPAPVRGDVAIANSLQSVGYRATLLLSIDFVRVGSPGASLEREL